VPRIVRGCHGNVTVGGVEGARHDGISSGPSSRAICGGYGRSATELGEVHGDTGDVGIVVTQGCVVPGRRDSVAQLEGTSRSCGSAQADLGIGYRWRLGI